ncbi:hypothetical protein, partial [Sinorhizobium meliloti]|uniref:hypothetical protein n=1 Tax=Rhizobium meliloti TaxID=382 RepID=UPI001AECAF48
EPQDRREMDSMPDQIRVQALDFLQAVCRWAGDRSGRDSAVRDRFVSNRWSPARQCAIATAIGKLNG